jgi:hypothetical protein
MEQKQASTKSSSDLVESDSQRNNNRRDEPKIRKSVNDQVSYAEAAEGKKTDEQLKQETLDKIKQIHDAAMEKAKITDLKSSTKTTNQQFLEQKLENCKKFISSIEPIQGTALEKAFIALSPKDVLEWVIWMKNEKKNIDAGVNEMFAMYKINPDKLQKEQFEKIKLYFTCFHSIAFPG